MLRTYVYVDGFNLYYRALKKTRYKWLDLRALFSSLLKPENQIEAIRYFTADVSARSDGGAPVRQAIYLNALRTIPEVSIHKGNFLVSKVMAKNVNPPPKWVEVFKTEEKGSDVNLASHLLLDGFKDRYDIAVVVSNDTDLVEPIRIARQELNKTVGLICPASKPAGSLTKVASFLKRTSPSRLSAAQFPDSIAIEDGVIHKPNGW